MNRRPPPDNGQMFNNSDTYRHKCFASFPQPSAVPPPAHNHPPTQFDIKKCLKKNVFIDSYYPKLKGYSDGSRVTSCDEVNDSWDTSTNGTYNPNPAPKRTTTTVCTTVDSRTYTLQSCTSDLDSTFVNPSRLLCNTSGMTTPKRDPQQASEVSPVGCFTHLYHRIHNLEKLLQQTVSVSGSVGLPSTDPNTGCDPPAKAMQIKCEKPKKVIETSGECGKDRGWNSTLILEAKEEKNNSDTDNEILNIKKRLQVLEKKLRKTKQSLTTERYCDEIKSCQDESDNSSNEHGCRLNDQETVFPQELCLPGKEILQISCNQKPKTKMKKKFMGKCRGIKRKCSSIFSSSAKSAGKSPLRVSNAGEWEEILYKRSVLTEESVTTAIMSYSTKTDNSNMIHLKRDEPRRKKKSKRKLCKKNSVTNFLPSKHRQSLREIRPPLASGDYNLNHPDGKVDPSLWGWKNLDDYPPIWISYPPSTRPKTPPQDPPTGKNFLKEYNLRNPLEILKRGGKIKIPILFEEVCKTTDPKDPTRKLSHVSMRFVVVEEDKHPLTPLRKLIKKLYLSKPHIEQEQFVFGVCRCRCDCQVPEMRTMSSSGFS